MAKISEIVQTSTLISILIVLILCYRRFAETEDIQKLRLRAQQQEERGRQAIEIGQRKEWRGILDQIQALKDTAHTQRTQLQTQEQELHYIRLGAELRRKRDEGYNKILSLMAPVKQNDKRTDSRTSKH